MLKKVNIVGDKRKGERIYKPIKLLFYYLGEQHEVFSVNISSVGTFVKTNVYPSVGSYVIFEHYHLKKKGITLGLIGVVRRVQKTITNPYTIKGIGVEWIRIYCDQGFSYLYNFMLKELNWCKFDDNIKKIYANYNKKIIFDLKKNTFTPTPEELKGIANTIKTLKKRKPTIDMQINDPFSVSNTEISTKEKVIISDTEESKGNVVFNEDTTQHEFDIDTNEREIIQQKKDVSFSDIETGSLFEVNIKIVFSISNQMYYGTIGKINEQYLVIMSPTTQNIKANSKTQIRLPVVTGRIRFMVIIHGFIKEIKPEPTKNINYLIIKIEYLDEFQNPGGFRKFIQKLKDKK